MILTKPLTHDELKAIMDKRNRIETWVWVTLDDLLKIRGFDGLDWFVAKKICKGMTFIDMSYEVVELDRTKKNTMLLRVKCEVDRGYFDDED